MKKTNFFAGVMLMVVMALPATAAEKDYNTIINLAGKQRMLTQKMSKEAVLVALGVNVEANTASLQTTRDLFDKTLVGLHKGDASLGLPETKKPKIVKALEKVGALWADMDPAVSAIAETGAADDTQISTIASTNLPLLKQMNKCVKLFEAQAGADSVNPTLAAAINLSGRQRMLTQKMSKEFFLIAKGHEVDVNKENLIKTVSMFDSTLKGLIDGDDSLGLPPAPTPGIKAQLEIVNGLWSTFKANIEKQPDEASINAVAQDNIPLLKEMNKAVGMYAAL